LYSKKFDLRIYVLLRGYGRDVQAYVCEEGMARFCTQDYRPPTKDNLRNLYMHLTNYSLNKNSDGYKAPPEHDFFDDSTGSKRLLSSLYKTLSDEGHDLSAIKQQIRDTVKKAVITLEPYLVHMYHQALGWAHHEARNFHIVGFDILLDTKLRAWLMEINANPSFNMFLERELPGGEVEKVTSELDKYLKARVATEAIKIVTGVSFLSIIPIGQL
jgi:tubulin polyglutamylase TTLL11